MGLLKVVNRDIKTNVMFLFLSHYCWVMQSEHAAAISFSQTLDMFLVCFLNVSVQIYFLQLVMEVWSNGNT